MSAPLSGIAATDSQWFSLISDLVSDSSPEDSYDQSRAVTLKTV